MPSASAFHNTIPLAARNFLKIKQRYGIFQGGELGRFLDQYPGRDLPLVEGLLPPRSVNILVGDSTIGKSPLAYQLGLSVAAGIPFLDLPVRRAKVLLVDFENAPGEARRLMDQQRRHLGLARFPHTFQMWPMHLDPLCEDVLSVIDTLAPDLAILDSLRSFNPKMESDHAAAVAQIRQLRAISARRGTAFLFVHHLRKDRRRAAFTNEDTHIAEWLKGSAGSRALINQTDVRIAVTQRPNGILLRGHYRTRGEIGPLAAERKKAGGRSLGYVRIPFAPDLLEDPEQQACYERLPEAFSFKQARMIYGKAKQSTNLWIHRMMKLGLIEKTAHGKYSRAGAAPKAETIQ